MAISNYSEIQTAVANWLDRDDLADRIPEFISLAEARFNRLLRLRSMESKQTASTVGGQRNYNLPASYIQMRNFQLNTSPLTTLSYVTPEIYDRVWGGSTGGIPKFYTIVADEISLGPIPGSVITMEMLFYKRFDNLSASTTTNWLLTYAPDIYLYATLMQASPYIMDSQSAGQWGGLLDRAMQELQMSDEKSRFAGGTLNMRPKYIYT